MRGDGRRYGSRQSLRYSWCDDDLRHIGRVRRTDQLARLPGHRPSVVLLLLGLPLFAVVFLHDLLHQAARLPGLAGLARLAERVPWRADDLPAAGRACWDGLMSLSGWRRPAVAGLLAFVVLFLAAYLVRLFRLRWLARRQGPVEVHFHPTGDCAELAEELRTCFLVELAETEVYGVSLLPGNRPQERLTDHLVEMAKAGTLLSALARLTRMAWPNHVYRVRVTVRERPGAQENKGAVVVLEVLTNNSARRPVAIWDSTQERLIRRAARVAAAQIIPWVSGRRMKRMAAWVEWIDRRLPDNLLDAYSDGKRMIEGNRYEEALEFLYNGLWADPDNLQIRLDIAAVYEKLSLWPDALNLYQQVQVLARRRLGLKQRGWFPGGRRWRAIGPSRACHRWRAERRSYRQALMVARLREIIICSYGVKLAEKWPGPAPHPGSSGTDRDWAAYYRKDLLQDLTDQLCCRLDELADPVAREAGHRLVAGFRGVATGGCGRGAEVPAVAAGGATAVDTDELGWVLAELAHQRARRLVREVRRWWWLPSWRTRVWLRDLGSGLRSLKIICLIARFSADRCRATLRHDIRPIDESELDREVRRILRYLPGPRARWIDHYNAACAYGIALRYCRDSPGGECPGRSPLSSTEYRLVDSALRHLVAMVECMDVIQLPNYVPWFRSEDPYLDTLRTVPEFQRFVDLYISAPEPRIRRPPRSREYENLVHPARIGRHYAFAHASWWREPAVRAGGIQRLVERWETECAHWDSVAELSRNHSHWRSRLYVIASHRRWSREQGREPLAWVHPGVALELPGERNQVVAQCADCAGHCARWVEERTTAIAGAFRGLVDVVGRIRAENRRTRQILVDRLNAGSPLPDEEWVRLCHRQAELWYLVGDFLSCVDESLDTGHEGAVRALRERIDGSLSRCQREPSG